MCYCNYEVWIKYCVFYYFLWQLMLSFLVMINFCLWIIYTILYLCVWIFTVLYSLLLSVGYSNQELAHLLVCLCYISFYIWLKVYVINHFVVFMLFAQSRCAVIVTGWLLNYQTLVCVTNKFWFIWLEGIKFFFQDCQLEECISFTVSSPVSYF